jgi:prepilin-type N-terminal cleavage/methylation domain-containing protein
MSIQPKRRDGGFALPEVLISIVIMSTIATVMASVVAVVLRNAPTTEARADDSRTLKGLVTWLPQDVDSTPPSGFSVDPDAESGCSVNPGTNLLRMQWSETAGSQTIIYIANYRHVASGVGYRIQRVTCSGTGAFPFANGFAQNVTSELPGLPTGWTPGNPPVAVSITNGPTGEVELVTFKVQTLDGKEVRTDAAPKNPDDSLPTTLPPSWQPPTPVTAVKSMTPPTMAPLAFTAHAGLPVVANLVAYDADGDVISLNVRSNPGDWVVTLVSTQLTIIPSPLAVAPLQGLIEIDVVDTDGMSTIGTVTVDIVDLTTPTTTSTTTTTTTTTTTIAPLNCQVLSRSISQGAVKNVNPDNNGVGSGNGVNVGVLRDPVTVEATTNADCTGVHIAYDGGGSNSPPFVNLLEVGDNVWRVVIPGKQQGSSELWADGTHQLNFFSAQGGAWGSISLTVE